MKSFEQVYYEQEDMWVSENYCSSVETERFRTIIKHIPDDVRTILDAGCGNGAFLKELLSSRLGAAVGIERSYGALKHASGAHLILGSVTEMPFYDASFDLVTSQEVLEHLPYSDYPLAISELKRVAKKHIIITVPNSEDLANALCACPHCRCWFNNSFHMRSFDERSLTELFSPLFRLSALTQIGPVITERCCPPKLMFLYRVVLHPKPSTYAICPQCGYMMAGKTAGSLTGKEGHATGLLRAAKFAAKLIFPQRVKGRRWLLGLYERNTF